MAKQDPYSIQYAALAAQDVQGLRAFDQRKVLDGIEQYLTYEPRKTSKSRIKQMTQPFWSQYRLRIDEFRVYYDVDDGQHQVSVLRVLRKTTGSTPTEPT